MKATYYRNNDGPQQTYTGPFFIGEGTHTIEYWSEDLCGLIEEHRKRSTLIYDTTPPTVEIIHPEESSLYIFNKRIMERLSSDTPLVIGQLNISVTADDADGFGVDTVFFSYGDETGYDNDSSNGWTDTNEDSYFGLITINVCAIDKKGHMSEPVQRDVFVFSLGLE
jgi:hypothetical protein